MKWLRTFLYALTAAVCLLFGTRAPAASSSVEGIDRSERDLLAFSAEARSGSGHAPDSDMPIPGDTQFPDPGDENEEERSGEDYDARNASGYVLTHSSYDHLPAPFERAAAPTHETQALGRLTHTRIDRPPRA